MLGWVHRRFRPPEPAARGAAPRIRVGWATLACALITVANLFASDQDTSPGAVNLSAVSDWEISADPPRVDLHGREAEWTVLIQAKAPDGRVVDLTRFAHATFDSPAVAKLGEHGEIQAQGDGATTLHFTVGEKSLDVPVAVSGTGITPELGFENDIVPLLNRFGCNSSGCHGKAEGQNGFKLSVFGFDPGADLDALTKQDRGRRLTLASPERSLLLRKASGAVPHGGGIRIPAHGREFGILRDWIAGGARPSAPEQPVVERIAIEPRERRLSTAANEIGGRQQLRVIAHFGDGHAVDVTRLARFQSNNDAVASVDEHGLVSSGGAPGQSAIMATYMGQVDVFRAIAPRAGEIPPEAFPPASNFIDELVNDQLRKLNIGPSPPASDAEYLRRIYLSLIGALPTAQEARERLLDPRPDRRAQWVEELLARPEYADFWALQWSDVLRVDRQTLGYPAARAYYEWIRESVATNKPWDTFAREIVTAEGPFVDAPQGHFYHVAPQPGAAASALSQVFLGVRIACAECHHHPYDRWSQTDYYGMVDYFAPLSRKASPRGEVLLSAGDPKTTHPRGGQVIPAHPLGAPLPAASIAGERRGALADWLVSGDNPWFAKNLANRLWAHFLGRGLVEPVDDVRDTNPPSNPELLNALADHLVRNQFDVKSLIRVILASGTFQRSSEPNATNDRDEQNYSRALFKRLDAEVLIDAVCQVTDIPESYPGSPDGTRAVQLWDSGSSSYFLKLFGRPTRQSACVCERVAEPSVAQVLHFSNSPEIHAKLTHDAGRVARIVAATPSDEGMVEELYLTFFSRRPDAAEMAVSLDYLRLHADRRRAAAEDLAWSMLNSLEFVFNH